MKTLRERFREVGAGSVRFVATRDEVLSFIEKELTTRENEIIEMIDGMKDTRDPKLMTYAGIDGQILSNRNAYQEARNKALKDIKSKILNK